MFSAFLYFSANSVIMKPSRSFLFFLALIIVVLLFENKWRLNACFNTAIPVISDLPILTSIDSIPFFGRDTVADVADSIVSEKIKIAVVFDTIALPITLEYFFERLKTSNDSLVRIIYFGDSQIEGDRITHPLRNAFQLRFGGRGIGYMPAEMYFNTTEQLAIITNDFNKDIVAYSSHFEQDDYGLYGRYFSPIKVNSKIRLNNRSKTHSFDNLKMCFSGKSKISIETDEPQLISKVLNCESAAIELIHFDKTPNSLRFTFSESNNFKLYGFLLDPEAGVVVDHVPFRGNSNLMLNRFEPENMINMGKMLNPALLVLHFGLNVVPDIRPDYKSYQKAIERDIHLLNKYIPHASILLVGVSDMAHRVNGQLQSYPNIDKIVEAQRLAAFNTGVPFYNLCEQMGGEGAIIEWGDKGWAKPDYAHFTLEGTEIVGQWLADYLLNQYDQYLAEHD